jgi:hypothetical protein
MGVLLGALDDGSRAESGVAFRFAVHPNAGVSLWRRLLEHSSNQDYGPLLRLLAGKREARLDPWLRERMEARAPRDIDIAAALCKDGGPRTRHDFLRLGRADPRRAARLLKDEEFRTHGIALLERADVEWMLSVDDGEVRIAAIAALSLLGRPAAANPAPAPPAR